MEKTTLDEIRERFRRVETELQDELEELVQRDRERFRYTVRAGRVHFEEGMRALHRSYRKGLIAYVRNAPIAYVLTALLTYALLLPLALLDASVTLFQQVCFRVYRIKRVRRRDYVVIDRQALEYLNAIEKLNCIYCGYGNGILAYAREVAARTEQFWCPIKHAQRSIDAHRRQDAFFDYGDAESYHADLQKIRVRLLD